MRRALLLVLTAQMCSAAYADGIRYDRIPADATGYAHMDFQRLVSSRLMHAASGGGESEAHLMAAFGGIGDATMYTMRVGRADEVAILWHMGDAALRARYLGATISDKDAIVISYDGQEIRFIPTSMQ